MARRKQEASILPAAYQTLRRSESVLGKLNGIPLEELKKLELSFTKFCFRAKGLMAAAKNVVITSELETTT